MRTELKSFLLRLAQDPLQADRFRATPGATLDGTSLDPQHKALLARREESALRQAVGESDPGSYVIMLVGDPELDMATQFA